MNVHAIPQSSPPRDLDSIVANVRDRANALEALIEAAWMAADSMSVEHEKRAMKRILDIVLTEAQELESVIDD